MKSAKPGRIAGWACLLLVAVFFVAATTQPSFRPVLPDASLWPQGRYIYQRHCLVCHGTYGDGRGEMGRTLAPPPRDFGSGVFKYRSTPSGTLPADADLERTIRGGLAGTAMPMFRQLSDREIKSVIEYVKGFSPRWSYPTNYAAPLVLPAAPAWIRSATIDPARAEQGRALYQAGCAACHGTDGSGRDATTKNLEDSWGHPVAPTDLRQPALRSGPELGAIYRVLLTGIEGTPMPAFADSFSDAQRWELVAFIARLRHEQAAKQ